MAVAPSRPYLKSLVDLARPKDRSNGPSVPPVIGVFSERPAREKRLELGGEVPRP